MPKLNVQGLPKRQAEALLHTANGLTRKEAAKLMGCSPQNVAQLIWSVLFKLRARNTPEAIAVAFQKGILRVMCAVMMLSAIGHTLPAPAHADEDDPLMRRLRSRPSGRGTRRVRRLRHDIEALPGHDKAFIDHYGLEPTLLWDDGLYLVYR